MKLAVVLGALLVSFAGGCSKKQDATPQTGSAAAGSGLGSGSAVATSASPSDAAVAAVAADPPPAPAVLEQEDVDPEHSELVATFGKQMPKLPAINADGTLIATLDDVTGGFAVPPAMQVTISKFPSGDQAQVLPILTYDEASHAGENDGDKWLTPELAKVLAARGKAIRDKLAGFHTLHPIPLDVIVNSFDINPAKIGDLTFTAEDKDMSLLVKLRTAKGAVIHHAIIDGYSTGKGDDACSYNPIMHALYTDPPKPRALYVAAGFRYRDDCEAPKITYLAWSTNPNSTTPTETIEDLVDTQMDIVGQNSTESPFAPDALIVSSNMTAKLDEVKLIGVVKSSMDYSGTKTSNVRVNLSRDGKSAWASADALVSITEQGTPGNDAMFRLSDVLTNTPQGWRIVGAAWTEPTDNATANKDAKAGKLKAAKLDDNAGDESLNAAFAKLTTEGATNVDKDLVAFGSGPYERTVGAASFTKPWNAAWKGKMTIVSSIARLAPSGTTGWVAATVELQKKGYKIPFTVFAVFDKDASGAWTLVHIHFAV